MSLKECYSDMLQVSDDQRQNYYVTLSHRWGKTMPISLQTSNQSDFERGIGLNLLPRTFQNAVDFARRLSPRVRYIWIDSLCIVQDDPQDWLRESVQMYHIY